MSKLKQTAVLGLILCLALGLRLFQLGTQELRGDEAFDALFSAQAVNVILDQLRINQPYPPLFHVGLHYWLGLVGKSEAMQRLPAFVSGVLLVPLVYQLARLTLGETTGLIAAALVAVNPFYVWHAQDGRMYSLLAALSAASLWLGLRLLQDRATLATILAYWAVTAAALLTHYFAWWLLLAENTAAALIFWKDRQRRALFGRWLLVQAAVVLALVPWLVFASGLIGSHASGWIKSTTALQMLQRLLLTFSLGSTVSPSLGLAFSAAMGALFLLGCFLPSRPVGSAIRFSGRALVLLYLAVPLLSTLLLSLRRPAFDEKYLIGCVACYLILVAHGLHFLGSRARLAGILAGIVLLLGAGWSLSNYYFDPDYAKSPKWRSLVESLQAESDPADIIVQNYPDPGLNYYYHGDLPIRLLPASETSPQESTAHALQKLANVYHRIWLIPAPAAAWDREGTVERWLARHTDLATESEHGSLHLRLYNTPQLFLEEMQPVEAGLGDRIRLVGYRLTPGAEDSMGPGAQGMLTLYWQALAPIDSNYTVFVHLAGPDEQIRGQHDGQPVGGTYPTGEWTPGEIVVDRHPIQISPAAPPGVYRLLVGMYDGSTGQRLAAMLPSGVRDEDRITLATLLVASPTNSGPANSSRGQQIENSVPQN